MPFLHLSNAGPLSEDQRRQLADELTSVVCKVTGKPRSSVYLRLDEVPRGSFAVAGELLADRDARQT